ncbi:TPA: hypothetical protein QCY29_000668 [Bacillus toyonensis]|nr:hypothetical protein [Bacillus toyonensis]
MKEFILSFLFSLVSLIVLNFLLVVYSGDYSWENTFNLISFLIIIGVPFVLFGCIVGEFVYKYIVLPTKLHYILSLTLYIFIGVAVIWLMMSILVGIPEIFEVNVLNEFLPHLCFAIVCSVSYFIKRNTYRT